MKSVFIMMSVALALSNFYILSEAAKQFVPVKVKNGYCLYKSLSIRDQGTAYPSGACESWYCSAKDKMVIIVGCGVRRVGPPCRAVPGKGAKYPDCCPKISCG